MTKTWYYSGQELEELFSVVFVEAGYVPSAPRSHCANAFINTGVCVQYQFSLQFPRWTPCFSSSKRIPLVQSDFLQSIDFPAPSYYSVAIHVWLILYKKSESNSSECGENVNPKKHGTVLFLYPSLLLDLSWWSHNVLNHSKTLNP